MVIFYDFEVQFQSQPDKINEAYEGTSGVIFTRVKEFVKQRLSILENEIEQQEGYIYIETTSYPFTLNYKSVTDELNYKMEQSLSKQDFYFLSRSIWEELYPGTIPPTN